MNKKLAIFLTGMFCLTALSYAKEPWGCTIDRPPTYFDATVEKCDSNGNGEVTVEDTSAVFECATENWKLWQEAKEKRDAAKASGNTTEYEKWKQLALKYYMRQGNMHNFANACSRKFGLFEKEKIEEIGGDPITSLGEIASGKYNKDLFGNDQTVCRACANTYEVLKEFLDAIEQEDRNNDNADYRKYLDINDQLFSVKPNKGICTKKGFNPYKHNEQGDIIEVVGITCSKEDRIAQLCSEHSSENQIKARSAADKAMAKSIEYCAKYQSCISSGGSNCQRYKTLSNNKREFAISRYAIANNFYKLCQGVGDYTYVAAPDIPVCR